MNNINIKIFLIFCVAILFNSCKRNTKNYTFISPYMYRVEYSDNKINIIKTDNTGKVSSMIWTKKNGEYFDQANHLKMTLKDTCYFLPQKEKNSVYKKQVIISRKKNDTLYSSSMSYLWNHRVRQMLFVVYYDKSYRIKRIESEGLCECVNK